MALATGLPPEVWAVEGEQAIVTAIELLREANKRADARGHPPPADRAPGAGSPQYSG